MDISLIEISSSSVTIMCLFLPFRKLSSNSTRARNLSCLWMSYNFFVHLMFSLLCCSIDLNSKFLAQGLSVYIVLNHSNRVIASFACLCNLFLRLSSCYSYASLFFLLIWSKYLIDLNFFQKIASFSTFDMF